MSVLAVESDRRQQLGQFLTPSPVADFMASMFGPFPSTVRLLDAGAGAGSLTLAFVSRCCNDPKLGVNAIEATLYEVDAEILSHLSATMQKCKRLCSTAGIRFAFTIVVDNFIKETAFRLGGHLLSAPTPMFNAAIANPPYRKIHSSSDERLALREIGIETGNLYTGFIALINRLLVPTGQLVAITPRSFCNGPYFRPFREDFLGSMSLHRLHVYESRKDAFRADDVLQENIIFHAIKQGRQPSKVIISTSSGQADGEVSEARYPFKEIVDPMDDEKYIHIPSDSSHSTAKDALAGLRTTLGALGVTVSTGRVVDFRIRHALRAEPENGAVPLLYPCHFNFGTASWPKANARKPNAILDNAETRSLLVPSGVYLLTKRFSAKEERRRVVACLFDPEVIRSDWVGFENHLNYFHCSGHGMPRNLALGLYAFLNSTVVDQYFRRFSGHTQVNATDLRKLFYPDAKTLTLLGSQVKTTDLTQDQIDAMVGKYLNGKV